MSKSSPRKRVNGERLEGPLSIVYHDAIRFRNSLRWRKVLPTSSPAPQTAVLLIAHGSRRASANEDLVQLAGLVAERGGFEIVEVAYLELAEPTIAAGGRSCAQRGARRVLMLPYFLSEGVHVATDLEEHRCQLAREFPGVEFVLCPHLGLHPLMAEIVLARLQEGDEKALGG